MQAFTEVETRMLGPIDATKQKRKPTSHNLHTAINEAHPIRMLEKLGTIYNNFLCRVSPRVNSATAW